MSDWQVAHNSDTCLTNRLTIKQGRRRVRLWLCTLVDDRYQTGDRLTLRTCLWIAHMWHFSSQFQSCLAAAFAVSLHYCVILYFLPLLLFLLLTMSSCPSIEADSCEYKYALKIASINRTYIIQIAAHLNYDTNFVAIQKQQLCCKSQL
jgi:hypothetical protein